MQNKIHKINQLKLGLHSTMLEALRKMDETYKRLLLVFDERKFINVLSIGDIQRAIIQNKALNTPISDILRRETRLARQGDSIETIKAQMLQFKAECMPMIDEDNNLVDVFFWEDFFSEKERKPEISLKLPVVIMAGGKGTRLIPLTNVIPKPLLPIGEKTIIEEIMDRFLRVGCNQFHVSVNYKAETIKHYFNQLNSPVYLIDYFQEDKPLGTAGSLFLVKDKIQTTFFVSNCDIIIEEDYSEILKYHKENQNELTIVSALKHYPIPYGTIKTKEEGILSELIEKPELTFQINSGFYILEPHLLNEIPENEFFHITTLIENIQKREGRVGVFPVSEGSWKDIGTWEEYFNLINKS
jgi:dTDP-glucose pyrophosphorylase